MNTNKIVHSLLLSTLALTMAGCVTPTAHPKLGYIKPAPARVTPFAMDANLVLEKQLCDHKIITKLHGGSEAYEYPVGAILCPYAEDVAKSCFRSVQVSTEAAGSPSAILLQPKLIKASHIMPLFHDQQMTFVVEWTVREPATGKTILLMTSEGRASAPLRGFNLGPGGARCIQSALADLYTNTVTALANSREIQQYVTATQK